MWRKGLASGCGSSLNNIWLLSWLSVMGAAFRDQLTFWRRYICDLVLKDESWRDFDVNGDCIKCLSITINCLLLASCYNGHHAGRSIWSIRYTLFAVTDIMFNWSNWLFGHFMVATSSHLWQCVKDTSQIYCIDRWIYLNLSMFEHWLANITIFW